MCCEMLKVIVVRFQWGHFRTGLSHPLFLCVAVLPFGKIGVVVVVFVVVFVVVLVVVVFLSPFSPPQHEQDPTENPWQEAQRREQTAQHNTTEHQRTEHNFAQRHDKSVTTRHCNTSIQWESCIEFTAPLSLSLSV